MRYSAPMWAVLGVAGALLATGCSVEQTPEQASASAAAASMSQAIADATNPAKQSERAASKSAAKESKQNAKQAKLDELAAKVEASLTGNSDERPDWAKPITKVEGVSPTEVRVYYSETLPTEDRFKGVGLGVRNFAKGAEDVTLTSVMIKDPVREYVMTF